MEVQWSGSRRLRPRRQLPVLSQSVGLGFLCIQLSLSGPFFCWRLGLYMTLKLYQVTFQAASAVDHIRQKSGIWTVTAINF